MTDLAQRQQEETSTRAFHLQEEIKACAQAVRIAWVQMAERLYHFTEQEMWRDLGYESFKSWCVQELDVGPRHAYQQIDLWKTLAVERGATPKQLAKVGLGKAKEVVPAVRRGLVTLDEALSDAEVLTRDDLAEKYRKVTLGERGFDVKKAADPDFFVCQSCGSRVPIKESA